MTPTAEDRIVEAVDAHRVVSLTQELIRLPSPLWEESPVAHYLAGYLTALGLEVEVQAVPVPDRGRSHQVIGRLRGLGGGPSLMLCGHTDTSRWGGRMYREDLWTRDPWGGVLEADGYIYGLGAHNMKAGLAAAVEAATAVVTSRIQLRGDLIVAAVIAETGGGVGAMHLLQSGLRTDMAIVTEASDLEIITISDGSISGKITVRGRYKHRLPHVNPCEKIARIITTLGPTYQPLPPGGWMRFLPHPELPGYPRMAVRALESGTDSCSLTFDLRTVPAQTDDTVKDDLTQFLRGLQRDDPALDVELTIPAGPQTPNMPAAPQTPSDHPLVTALSAAHVRVHGRTPVVGSGYRLGYTADSSHFKTAGIVSVEYGPGNTQVWPMIDERVRAADVILCARALAGTAVSVCG